MSVQRPSEVLYLTDEQGSRLRLGEIRGHYACGRLIEFKPVRYTPGVAECSIHGEVAWRDTYPSRIR